MKEERFGERLIRAGLISQDQLDFALKEQKRTGQRLGTVLRQLNLITEDDLARMMADTAGIDHINLRNLSIDPRVAHLLPEAFARKHKVFPVSTEDSAITVAMADPLDVGTIDRLQQMVHQYVKVVSSTEFDILTAIDKYFGSLRETEPFEHFIEEAVRQPLIRQSQINVRAGLTMGLACAPSCGRTRTSSLWAKCATRRRSIRPFGRR